MSTFNEYKQTMAKQFNQTAAKGVKEIFQFNVEDELFHLVIADGGYKILVGEHQAPSVTLVLENSTLKGLLDGRVNGITAFMMGKIKATGNIMLATKLPELFPA